jgi:hypothetical protein
MDMQGDDVAASGILWPWIPPPETLDKKTIEWKIRKFQNWENVHPACQLIRTSLMKKNGWKFADTDGHDVNHGFMEKAKAAGYHIVGLMPTRCPLVDPDFGQDFDVETNRLESVIFGDMVYHHVGATRKCRSQTTNNLSPFKKSRERVYNESGAGWMLLPENAHVFKMDREEDIAQLRMKTVYQVIRTYLQTHGTLFGNDWA